MQSPDDLIGTAIALTAAVRTIGGAIGTAVIPSVITSYGYKKVPKAVATYAVKAGFPEYPEENLYTFARAFSKDPALVAKIPGVTPRVLKAAELGKQMGYAETYHLMFYILLAFGILATAACAALPNVSKFMTNKVVAQARRSSSWKVQKK